jgi:hypothetical protein
MARISSYPTDDNVSGSDKVLGTDTSGATKNYLLDEVAGYFSKNNTIAVGGQVVYYYKTSRQDLTHAQFTANDGGASNNVLMSSIQDLVVFKSVNANEGGDRSGALRRILNDRFTIYGVSNPNDYYDYEVTRIEDHSELANAYLVTLVPIEGNSSSTFTNEEYYSIVAESGDKSYEHIQSNSSATWVITHNLGKYPAVAVQDSAGSDVFGEVEYNSIYQLTITFSGAFSGSAYLN